MVIVSTSLYVEEYASLESTKKRWYPLYNHFLVTKQNWEILGKPCVPHQNFVGTSNTEIKIEKYRSFQIYLTINSIFLEY